MSQKIRTLLVEDSGLMRILISDLLRRDPEISLVDTATNGKEGVEKVRKHKPDVVITDMIMPKYDGLFVVQRIMQEIPTPVIVLSALEKTDPKVFDALHAGAFDFVDKPRENVATQLKGETYPLLAMVKAAMAANAASLLKQSAQRKNNHHHTFGQQLNYDIIAIGASTGGPGAIEAILKKLPVNLSIPVVVAQHMPERFLEAFAMRLNNHTPLTVKLAQKGEILEGGVIYIAPGHSNMKVGTHPGSRAPFISFSKRSFKEFNFPSIDCLFASVAATFGKKAIGVVLTGMGKDGTEGLGAIAQSGGFTIAQDEQSSVVFGMPKSAWEAGVARQLVRLTEIPGFLVSCL